MNLAALDLNLLLVLRALLAERSVTRAAKRVGLSQPATSHAVARLREILGDPLFVRSGRDLALTPRAEALRVPLEDALGAVERALDAPRPFDPKTTKQSFTIATSDYALFVLLPSLLERLAHRAPGVDLRVRDLGTRTTTEWLSVDAVDFVIGVIESAHRPGIEVESLFGDSFACLVRKDHPLVQRKLTLPIYASLPHAFVAPRGTLGGVVDDALEKRGHKRRVALLLPNFLVAPQVVARSDLVVTLGARIAKTFAHQLPLRVMPPPLSLPDFRVSLAWHERMAADPAHAWLRAQIREAAAKL